MEEQMLKVIEGQPTVSTKHPAARTNNSLASECRTLHVKRYYPYHIQSSRELEPHDAPARREICNSQTKTAFTANSLSVRQFSINLWAAILGECLTGHRNLLARVKWRVCLNFLLTHLSGLVENRPFRARLHRSFQRDGAPSNYSRRVRHWMCKNYPGRWFSRGVNL
jgi:hypothetical protein